MVAFQLPTARPLLLHALRLSVPLPLALRTLSPRPLVPSPAMEVDRITVSTESSVVATKGERVIAKAALVEVVIRAVVEVSIRTPPLEAVQMAATDPRWCGG
ncbi:hypothetical protein GUJ93_ZPchr0008g12445 [Zizania palustris]|uniref:Uncharacterized protein n=1 Tax=Zizania palustris TaxID=103762 RepID=A0A8J5VKD4_ZIZPA|nr:hypothetical protein GUJ93_ZPchr0008g12445 [Zizania palustris]